MLASSVFEQNVQGFLDSDLVYSVRHDAVDVPYIDVWWIRFRDAGGSRE